MRTLDLAATLVIVGNGPGEVAGWAVPLALEARRQSVGRDRPIQIALCLPICQGASGQEAAMAGASGAFDLILGPSQTLRLCLGLPGWRPAAPAVVLHVGGEFWYSRRLARRWRASACAFVERAHIARAHRPFAQIFVPGADLMARLTRAGVPADKVRVTGDPRHDALPDRALVAARNGDGEAPRITMLTGSRNAVFSAFFPFWMQTAAALRARRPEIRLRLVVSPYVAPGVRQAVVARHRAAVAAAAIEVVQGGLAHIAGSDLVLTVPGTNTLELAVMRIPSIVVLPYDLAPKFAIEGAGEWITRFLPFGQRLKRVLTPTYLQRLAFVALPNLMAHRRIMPELVGDVTPAQVADESLRLLHDEAARGKLVEDLRAIPDQVGASRAIVAALPLWADAT